MSFEIRVYVCRPGGAVAALRGLLRKTLESGHRAVVQTAPEIVDALDRELWLGGGEILPHGRAGEGSSARQPVLLTADEIGSEKGNGTENGSENGADYLFQYLVPESAPPEPGRFARNFVIVQEGSMPVLDSFKSGGYELSLWSQEPSGRWRSQEPQ
ncbi:MAG: DNA polymerase III subunit chi [Alphaproteobacteria bacterium]